MALPMEFRTERLEYLDSQFKEYSINDLESLRDHEYRLLGYYIQMFSFMEMNIHKIYNDLNSIDFIRYENSTVSFRVRC